MIYTHSHHQLSSLITCIHHTTVPEHLFGAEYECVRHPLCLSSNHHCDIYFQVYFVGLTVTSHPYTHIIVILMNSSSHIIVILMNSSSHIVIIIISLNLLQTRISYLNHLAIFSSRVTLSQISSIGGFLIIKVCTEQGRNLLLVVSFKSVYAEQGRTSCWLFPKSLKVYAEQGIMPLVGFIISSSSCA